MEPWRGGTAFPKFFTDNYPTAPGSVITPDNYMEFLIAQ